MKAEDASPNMVETNRHDRHLGMFEYVPHAQMEWQAETRARDCFFGENTNGLAPVERLRCDSQSSNDLPRPPLALHRNDAQPAQQQLHAAVASHRGPDHESHGPRHGS